MSQESSSELLPTAHRGLSPLRELLDAYPIDVRTLDAAAYRAWVQARIAEVQRDPVFVERSAIRDLLREHRRKLRYRQRRIATARAAYVACGCAPALHKLEGELHRVRQGVAGLARAVAEKRADPAKLKSFTERANAVKAELDERTAACPERGKFDEAKQSLDAFESEIGLPPAQTRLAELQRNQGRSGSRRGRRFESVSEQILVRDVIPELGSDLVCLSGATLGCARGEFDHLLVRVHAPHEPVEVVAMVEAKRNPNDLAHGFRLRQENLAWFRDHQAGFDRAQYRNATYPTGRFDRVVKHVDNDVTYLFSPDSFENFQPDDAHGEFLRGLWFVTERRPLIGVSSEERARILAKLATDVSLNLDHPPSIGRTRGWVQRTVSSLQARDVLERYATEALAPQIVLLERRA